jgi:hypothetical protein
MIYHDIRNAALVEAAAKIRAEWVCGCVDESDDWTTWHPACKYSEFAAKNVEALIFEIPQG